MYITSRYSGNEPALLLGKERKPESDGDRAYLEACSYATLSKAKQQESSCLLNRDVHT